MAFISTGGETRMHINNALERMRCHIRNFSPDDPNLKLMIAAIYKLESDFRRKPQKMVLPKDIVDSVRSASADIRGSKRPDDAMKQHVVDQLYLGVWDEHAPDDLKATVLAAVPPMR